MRPSTNETLSAAIASHTAAFLANGGEINQLPGPGDCPKKALTKNTKKRTARRNYTVNHDRAARKRSKKK